MGEGGTRRKGGGREGGREGGGGRKGGRGEGGRDDGREGSGNKKSCEGETLQARELTFWPAVASSSHTNPSPTPS